MLDFSTIDISSSTLKAFTTLFDHWQEMRGENSVPRKSAINPMKISSILPEVAIMERMDADTVLYRLAGTALAERAGSEMTNINTLDTFSGEARKYINKAYSKSAAHPAAGYHRVILSYEKNTSFEIDCLYLPLCDDEGDVRFHIAVLYVEDKAAQRLAMLNKFIGYKVPRISYPDIGYGSPKHDDIPDHVARLD